ncbi:MAG: DNA mismatch repair endonuclease MutL [Bacteroidaceae bacterium]|nr:DNA mismatch repair endonuclease MutL [Bacteroidaceae bacterium]
MSDIIHLLPDTVANQIAAGEVIQRPASLIKELVENSIDAGAKNINVIVVDAGKTCVQVIDDGKGMSETDARLSFERHATSKIKEAADLFKLHTMGFRGEALASIAAVAQVELRTRQHDSELGTSVCIEGGKLISQEPTACAEGANFIIKNLFFNIPARRKFLKSNHTELSNIIAEFEKIALVHPDVSFTLNNGETEMYNLPVTSLRQRIVSIFGKKLNQQLMSFEAETSLVKLTGFVGKPDSAKKKGSHQYFFVNGRYMRHPYFHKAVMSSFEQLIPVGEQVSYFIYFEVDPANIDVNIHPTKTEIKFEDEQPIWQILAATIRETLGKFNAVPTIDFDTADRPDIPVFNGNDSFGMPQASFDPTFNPFDSMPSDESLKSHSQPSSFASNSYKPASSDSEWMPLYENVGNDMPSSLDMIPSGSPTPQISFYDEINTPVATAERSASHYQFKGRFIMTAVKSGLMIIDQHRAHKHILFHRYMKQIESNGRASQGLLFPEILQLPQSESVVLDNNIDILTAVGFELNNLGGGSYAIVGIPAGTEGLNAQELLQSIVNSIIDCTQPANEEIKSRIALSLASSAAIVAGQVLSNEEMEALIDELFQCETPSYTKDGNLIFTIVKQNDIDKLFG